MKAPQLNRSSLCLLLCAALPQLGACALVSRGETLQVRYFTLDERAGGDAPVAKSELALRLGRIDASGGLGEQIAVRKGDHEISYRDDQRWTERPAQYVRRELERALFSEHGLMRSYSGLTPTLEVELVELELVETDKQAQARVRLTAQIRDDRRNLCQDNFETQLPIAADSSGTDPRTNMERGVKALSTALHNTVQQLASRAVQCLQTQSTDVAAKARSTPERPERLSKRADEPAESPEGVANAQP